VFSCYQHFTSQTHLLFFPKAAGNSCTAYTYKKE
jgi:hypothetical protein